VACHPPALTQLIDSTSVFTLLSIWSRISLAFSIGLLLRVVGVPSAHFTENKQFAKISNKKNGDYFLL
jgi:hypothetical protein